MNGPFRDQTFTSSHAWYSRVPGCIFVHTVECKVAVVGCLNRQERLFITIKLWVSQFRSAFHIFLTSSFLTTAIVIIAIITFDGPKKILCFPPNVCGYDKLQNSKMGRIKNTWAQLIWKLIEEKKVHGTVGEFKSANFQESQPSTSTIEAIHPAVEWSFPRWKVLWQRPNICTGATQTLLGNGAPRAFQCFAMNNASPAPLFNCLIQSTNFGQPETWPVCRFRFCFLDIRIRTIQLKHEGWGAFIWTTASQDDFVGFNPLTILSGQGHISELVPQHSHFSDDQSS